MADPSELDSYLRAIDEAFQRLPRPAHFTNHLHCDECAEADEFFDGLHSPAALAEVTEPAETLPLAFLTDDAFLYFMPSLARMSVRGGREYSADTVLLFLELRLDAFGEVQRAALRDLLYAFYEHLPEQIEDAPSDYSAVTRLVDALEAGGEEGRR